MFKMFRKKKEQKEVENLFQEIQINLENNYKDEAIYARKQASQRLEEMRNNNELSEQEYAKWKKVLDEYTNKMIGYHH